MSRKDAFYRGTKCLNCNTPLDISEKYCHHCGQLNSTKKITLSDFIEEFFSNFYAYDSKLRNSLISIFTKPGILAKRYNAGQRSTFANPFRLFLSISIILFITINLTEGDQPRTSKTTNVEKTKSDSLIVTTNLVGKIEKRKVKNLHVDSIYTKKIITENCTEFFNLYKFTILTFRNSYLKHPTKSVSETLIELGFEDTKTNHFLFSKAKSFKTNDIKTEMFDYFYEKLPFLIFISLPIITIIFWLVFYKKELNYTEHLVFVYTFYTFLFICLILTTLFEVISLNVSNFLASLLFFLVFPYYLYKSLRNFYQLSRWKTLFKLVILHPLFVFILIIAFFILFFFGIILM